ncbi:hypothetical protein OWM54_41920 [Myxococcus sp. MISCRS1]|uniref:hypothetical protein n=1 Tax=Myxococcus sp. MISCRS1 TaxID=2996786 RepID=UPI00227206B3|nr:hypothetical protein [Myxococcus sp. MISCRS1]MCY1003722.1 hypothetical protein [Myxococcus sp. MISCRS1]
MTGPQVDALRAATRHAGATGGLWHAQRLELMAHAEWVRVVAEMGPGARAVEEALQAFYTAQAHRKWCAGEVESASNDLSASMRAVMQESRR